VQTVADNVKIDLEQSIFNQYYKAGQLQETFE